LTTKKIYLTHCSAKKNPLFEKSKKVTTPDKLYTATLTQRFIKRYKERNLKWAVFSDKYGVWFHDIKRGWYEKSPDTISKEEFNNLVIDFDRKLKIYDEIWFFYNPGRFHKLYRQLLSKTCLKDRIRLFTHLNDV
jgi:hypothetical protein